MYQLMALEHRLGCLLVVTTANQVELRFLAHLHALVVVRQGDFKSSDTVV